MDAIVKFFKEGAGAVTQRYNYYITDYFWSIDDILAVFSKRENNSIETRIANCIAEKKILFDVPLYLALLALAITCSICGIFLEVVSQEIWKLRNNLVFGSADTDPLLFMFLKYYVTIVIILIGAMLIFLQGGPQCVDSGLSDVKFLLAGVNIRYIFNPKFALVKGLSLTLLLGGGFFMGRVGPFLDIMSNIANFLYRLSIFRSVKEDQFLKRQFIQCALAAGMTVTTGTVFGGLINSIELTSTVYNVSTLWRSFLVCFLCMLFTKYWNMQSYLQTFTKPHIPPINIFENIEILVFIGVAAGVSATLFSKLYIVLGQWRIKHPNRIIKNDFIFAFIITFIVTVVVFTFKFLQLPDRYLLNPMINLDDISRLDYIGGYTPVVFCFIVACAYFWLPIFVLSLPIPKSVSSFLVGAAIGRFILEILRLFFNFNCIEGLTLVFATAYMAAGVRLISSTILAIELTGELDYVFPIFLSTTVAFGVANLLCLGIFEAGFAYFKGAYLPLFPKENLHEVTAADFCLPVTISLTTKSLNIDGMIMLSQCNTIDKATDIPVLDPVTKTLKGSINTGNFVNYLAAILDYEIKLKGEENPTIQDIHNFISHLGSVYEKNNTQDDSRRVDINTHLRESIVQKRHFLHRLTIMVAKRSSLSNSRPTITPANAPRDSPLRTRLLNDFEESAADANKFFFIDKPIHFSDESLFYDPAPLSIRKGMRFIKIQYLFCMLGITSIYVCDDQNIVVGIITKEQILNMNKGD